MKFIIIALLLLLVAFLGGFGLIGGRGGNSESSAQNADYSPAAIEHEELTIQHEEPTIVIRRDHYYYGDQRLTIDGVVDKARTLDIPSGDVLKIESERGTMGALRSLTRELDRHNIAYDEP